MHKTIERLYFAADKLKGFRGRGAKADIARAMNIGQDSLVNWEKRGMSAESMIIAEEVFGCTAVWLKTGKGDVMQSVSNVCIINTIRIPLLRWDQIGIWMNSIDKTAITAEQYINFPLEHSLNAFCLRVTGMSMHNHNGDVSFSDGDIILVEPDITQQHGDFIVASQSKNDQPMFRQLIIDNDQRYLKALNASWPNQIMKLNDNAVIHGTVAHRWSSFIKK